MYSANTYNRAMNQTFKGPVAVAVSGGMDSLYSLLSLKEQGAEVFALHALFLPEYLRGPQALEDLPRLKAAVHDMGITLHIVDLSAQFEALVIRPFIASYIAGNTPNPCARCNPHLKFGLLWDEAARLGAAHIATGHYVKLLDIQGGEGPAVGLFAGDDATKDQSYFLAMTPLEKLGRIIFPLARRKKSDIAAELLERGIEVPQKGESQEICFITNNDYRAFLKSHALRFGLALPGPGTATLPDGGIVGRHNGLWAYTQGQRKGLGIAWQEPLYVLGKNTAANRLIVGPRSAFNNEPCLCVNINLLMPPGDWPERVLVKTRYRQRPQFVRPELRQGDGQLRLVLHFETDGEVEAPPAPGQIAALYVETEQGLRLAAGAEISGDKL